MPLPPARARGGSDDLAGRRAADRPLHAGAGAVAAELGARTSFRDGARVLESLLLVPPANHESLRTRTHAVALQPGAADRQVAAEGTAVPNEPAKAAAADASRPVVMPDGIYIRSVPGHQARNFEAICGKVEQEGHAARRFALVRSVAGQPHALLRAALLDQGWREGEAVTAISDGDSTLPALVRSATGSPVEPILNCFHPSMRMQHAEQVMGGLCALEPPPRPARPCSDRRGTTAASTLERPPREGVRGPGPDRKLGQGRHRAGRT